MKQAASSKHRHAITTMQCKKKLFKSDRFFLSQQDVLRIMQPQHIRRWSSA